MTSNPLGPLFRAASYDLSLSALARTYVERGEQIPECVFAAMNQNCVEMAELARELEGEMGEAHEIIEMALNTVAAFEGAPSPGLH